MSIVWVTAADSPTPLGFEQVEDALVRAAEGMMRQAAAVMLLAFHDHWLRREDFRQYVLMLDDGDPRRAFVEPMYARVDWTSVVDHMRRGVFEGGSGSERAMLQIAASLAESSVMVGLGEAVSGLDHTNTQIVQAAIVHAAHGQAEAASLWPARP